MNPFKVLSLKDGMHLKIISSASQNATWMIKIALPAAMSLIWTLMTDQQAAPRLRSNAPARRGVIVCVNLWKCCPPSRWFSVSAVAERSPSRSSGGFRHRVGMPNKDRPQVERHPPKKVVGWLAGECIKANSSCFRPPCLRLWSLTWTFALDTCSCNLNNVK